MGFSLGIDFGTSTTKVALRRGNDIPLALPIGKTGKLFMPSVVAYRRTKDDRAEVVAIGENAAERVETEDVHVVREVKRAFAATESEPLKLPSGRYPWWNPRDMCVQLWSDQRRPHDVVLSIVSEALERAVQEARKLGLGTDIDSYSIRGFPARLGCSVTAGLEARRTLSDIARRLGFQKFTASNLIEEPILASLAYIHHQVTPNDTILVYDLGGGTFDAAVVKVHEESAVGGPVLTVFAADGDPYCGGADIDEALFGHLVNRMAEEHFGFKGEDRAHMLNLMNPSEKQVLRNQAQEAKEVLSEVDETTVVLPPGFLGGSGIVLSIKRSELEAVVRSTKLIDKTLDCVLRCWRRARMLFRKQDEQVGSFHLEYDRSSGMIGGPVLRLDHHDIEGMVTKVLMIGGSTRMPIIRQTLSSLWGQRKFVPEEVVKPIEACSVGAAWQQESINAIVDRLPFSIALRWDSGKALLYQAYRPTVTYRTLAIDPSVNNFKSRSIPLQENCKDVEVTYETPDGQTEVVQVLGGSRPGLHSLEIDMFGRCILKDGLGALHELPNGCQHPKQQELYQRLQDDRKREETEAKRRTEGYLRRLPGQDLHDEVG